MPFAYEGPASVTVIALYRRRPPSELTTLELPVVLSDTDSGNVRIDFGHYLQGPKYANALRVVLPDGQRLHGRIIDGRNEPLGGWLEFHIEPHELTLDPPTHSNGWKWE